MAMRDDLHQIIDELPETDVPMAIRFLRGLRVVPATGDDLVTSLEAAPDDDEPVTDDDRAASALARQELAEGRGLSAEEVRRMISA
ncbi:MAG: hypothetical protein H7338_12890 [Candidatus Sericytochromatia bacterium]|nr:hypothetical protein [Candidatus Sericytochromatia bacterium]